MTTTTTVLIAILGIAGFVGLWCGVILLLAVTSGWSSLARRYRGRLPESEGEYQVTMGSAQIGWVTYNNIVNVSAGPLGVEMSLFPLFAIGAPALAFPWQALGDHRRGRAMGMFDRFSFSVDGDVTITLGGGAARMMDDAWKKWAHPHSRRAEAPT